MPHNFLNPQSNRRFAPIAMEIRPRSETRFPQEEASVTVQKDEPGQMAPPPSVGVETISILLVDDHALMREGLRQLFSLEDDLHVVDEAVDGFEALQKVRELLPDVVLMDISMPMIDGIAVTHQISREFPDTAVIIVTMHRQDQQVLQAIKSGARGYLLKTASSQELAATIQRGKLLAQSVDRLSRCERERCNPALAVSAEAWQARPAAEVLISDRDEDA